MPNSDLRWGGCARSQQGGQVGAARVFFRAQVGKELSKAGLCIQARCEKEGARAIVILA